MTHSIHRLEELVGSATMRRLLAEFGGQSISFPAPSTANRDAAILAEFDGMNYSDLARRHNVTSQWVYHLVKHSRLQSVSLALRQVAGIEPEVVWAAALADQHPLTVLEAGLQAFETAKEALRAEADVGGCPAVMHRLLVAIAVLPPAHPVVLAANSRASAPAAPAESPPETPAPPSNPPPPTAAPPSPAN